MDPESGGSSVRGWVIGAAVMICIGACMIACMVFVAILLDINAAWE